MLVMALAYFPNLPRAMNWFYQGYNDIFAIIIPCYRLQLGVGHFTYFEITHVFF